MTRTHGYVRVSTGRQSVDQQVDALLAAGVSIEHIYGDVRSGAKWDRPGLIDLKRTLREGDTLVVVALDRLGRSLSEMVALLGWLTDNGIVLRSLRENIDLSTPAGQLMAAVFAAMAQYERALIIERAEAAREAARARGKQTGRPRTVTDDKISQARDLIAAGTPKTEAARLTGVSRASLYRALAAQS